MNKEVNKFIMFYPWFLGIILGMFIGILIFVPSHKEPKAIDVYLGKTTLEITSVNGIPIDTVVVFKNK